MIPRCRQNASSAPAKSWFGRSRSAKARLVVVAFETAAATGPNSLKLVSAIALGGKKSAVEAKGVDLERLGDKRSPPAAYGRH